MRPIDVTNARRIKDYIHDTIQKDTFESGVLDMAKARTLLARLADEGPLVSYTIEQIEEHHVEIVLNFIRDEIPTTVLLEWGGDIVGGNTINWTDGF